MAYQVDRFNGTFLVSVADGTIDTTTDIRFVGKNYAGYGEVQNENFLHLLENFANTSAPPKAITGQIWYDSSTKKLKFYDGTRFKMASGAEVSSTAPSNLTAGDFWFDETAQQLYTWSGSEFVLIGPAATPEFGTSAATGIVVQDNVGSPRTIVELISGGDVVAIISKEEFTLGSINPITGFSKIKKGITLTNTDAITGVTSGFSGFNFWGTASDSLRLGGIEANQFLIKGNLNFEEEVSFTDAGFTLGDDNDLRVRVETKDPFFNDVGGNPLKDDDQIVIEQATPEQPITIRMAVTQTQSQNILKIRPTGVFPATGGVIKLGSSDKLWSEIWATTVNASLVGNVTGNVTGIHTGNLKASDNTTAFDASIQTFFGTLGTASNRALVYGDLVGDVTGTAQSAGKLGVYEPSLVSSPSTVVIRDASSNIAANQFTGTATQAIRMKIDNAATDSDPNFRSAKTTATANTIAARDSSGNLFALLFDGTATAARYADLAEKYLPDADYEPGTVVVIGGEKEITASTWGQRAVGVISTNPAFMMNKDLEGGVYVALKGRVPVKVTGAIKKGQRLVASNNGAAVGAVPHASDVFAIALESSDDTGVKLIEAVIL